MATEMSKCLLRLVLVSFFFKSSLHICLLPLQLNTRVSRNVESKLIDDLLSCCPLIVSDAPIRIFGADH